VTREEIMRLEGRELDAAVAEHVMGWTNVIYSDITAAPKGVRPDGLPDAVPHYSEDIAAAWQVVERLTAMGYQFELAFVPRYEPEPWLALFFVPPRRPAPASSAFAATAAEAICRAALLAVCGEENRDADA